MDSVQPAAGRPTAWKWALLVLALGASCLFTLGRSGLHSADAPPPAQFKPPARPSLYTKTEPARNPEKLTLLTDSQKVVGWISGSKDHAGEEVKVVTPGKTEKVKVEAGNTFTWPYKVGKNTRAEFALGTLRQTVLLGPPETFNPTAFFVVDRNVYRPGQELHFAAFLRQMDERGEFQPLTGKAVEVQLKTERKSTIVTRWKLTSDDLGRVTGSYKFTDADPLDTCTLAIANHQGQASVSLAEYRKAKVQLQITGERVGSRVKLRFQALDFMDKPVPARKVAFTAQVVRNPTLPPAGSLKGEDFAHPSGQRHLNLRMEDLSPDEQLLVQVDPTYDPGATLIDPRQAVVVASTSGEVDLAGKPAGEFTLNVPKTCQQPGHGVIVAAVLTDASGREERKTQTIPLQFLSEDLKLILPRTAFEIDQPIRVKATTSDGKPLKGLATLIAMKLSAAPPQAPPVMFGFQGLQVMGGIGGMGAAGLGGGIGGHIGFQGVQFMGGISGMGGIGGIGGFGSGFGSGFNPGFGFSGVGMPRGMQPGRWQTVEPPESVKRTLVTATVFKGGTATLRLSEPGAYKLVAIVERPDGSKWQQETGCLIQPRNERQPLTLVLDRTTYATGDTLTGVIQSKYAGARVLLSFHDSVGVRGWKTVQLDKKGVAEIKQVLPYGLRYGCIVTAQYANDPTVQSTHMSSRSIHVEPADRTLKIETKTKPVYEPGEKVVLDVQVNRNEPIDLIVSVFDQALVNIKPKEAADIRSFYLADERAFDNQGRDQLRCLLAGVTVDSLLKKAKKLAKDPQDPSDVFMNLWLAQLLANAEQRQFTAQDVVTLLNLAGVKARLSLYSQYSWGVGSMMARIRGKNPMLVDLLNAEHDGWRLHVSVLNDTFIVSDYNPLQSGDVGFNRFGFQGGMMGMVGGGFGGMMGMGGFGGGFQGSPSVLPGGVGALGAVGGLNGAPSVLPGKAPQQPGLIGADADQKNLLIRRDFSDSAYWNAKVRTDDMGKAHVEFKVPDSLTSWQVVVTGVSPKMHVGQGKAWFQVSKPVMVGPILPRLFTEGDVVKVSANVVNRSKEKQKLRVRLKVENGQVLDRPETELTLDAGQSEFVFWTYKAGTAGFTQLLMSAECPAGSDASLKRLPVVAAAVEEVRTGSGFCKEPALLNLPEGVDPQTANLEIRFAPTLAADLVDTLDYLVEYPYGCVEQTMSRFLPAIKVAQILKQCRVEHPGLTQRLPGVVRAGIKRLLELQQPDGGWGWNGNAQTHEMMTPYALYGLMLAEKAGYALNSEDAVQKGLNRLKQFIDNMKTDRHASDRIFCMYVYCHRHEMTKDWWQYIDTLADKDKLSDYALALALDLAMQKDKKQLADFLAARLAKRARDQAGLIHWTTAGFTRWADDPLEITAVVLKALVAHNADDKLIPGVLAYFNANKHGNRWNSTKDTALIVFALCDYLAKQNLDAKAQAKVSFRCNDGPLTAVKFEGAALTSKVVVPAAQLKQSNTITFVDSTPGVMYRLILRHSRPGKDVAPHSSGIAVVREYWLLDGKGKRVRQLQAGDAVPVGSYLESVVKGTNEGAANMTYVLVENPRPSSCEFIAEDDQRFNQNSTPFVLREEREALLAYHHEQAPQIEDRCVLYAELAGEFVVAPARVELMYQTEVRGHSGTFRFKVVDKEETPKKP